MKYIVTEEQYKLLSEINVQQGSWDPVDSYVDIFTIIKERVNEKNIKNAIKDYIKNEIGYIIFKWKQKEINIFQEMPEPTPEFIREQKRFFFLLKIKEKMKRMYVRIF